MANLRNRERKQLFSLRIADELRMRVDELGMVQGRTTSAALIYLVERGLDMHAMLARNDNNGPLLFELFAAVREDADAASVIAVLQKRWSLAELAEAFAKLESIS